ncbi:AMP-dependent synthetase/ligase [Acididesulfobacillus acetoxydans]|uniref:AMP-dependent synthetase/ligase n=1 Tax=Acididesulfobacillus acetoxydans TaxID=1561005 RepID=A0A8S0W8Q8_9FIRM|nr:AMP-binding protein [Acididesulfobacillus acetoxydans]CAA7601989.1 AMP-dependent synthetase/ligase [Acididesulfobacillus acetoxydans]CEJ08167.1 Long-chain-fatty-acid--CoA ligase [Acididesulfobacillus acetoxydans]
MAEGLFTYDVTMFKETFEHEFTYLNGFLRNVHRFAGRRALTCPLREKTWTYKELNEEANQLAHALEADGVGKNEVVMYQLLNSAEFVFCYLAPQKLGAINCPINFRLSPGETAFIIDDSRPAVYVFDAEIRETAEQALAMAEHKPRRLVMVDIFGQQEPSAGQVTYQDYVRNRPQEDPVPARQAHIYDETTRLYTSGTTGMPKGVPINNINDLLSAHDVIMHFPLSSEDRTMNMSPWFHRGGLHSGGPTPTLYVGGEIVVLRQFYPKGCLELAEKYGVTFLIGAPPMLKMLYEAQLKTPADLSRLKGIVTMGAPLEREACIRFQEALTPNIFNGYGTSEAFWNTFLRPHDLPAMAGSAGRACTDDDVAVVKTYPDRRGEPDDYVDKDNREVGEIIVKAPNKTTYTYLNDAYGSEKVFYKGWIYIGDVGTWDENEFVTIVGRKDDMVNSAGENIHPVQVEEVLNQHPKVKESIVTGVPDELRGEAVAAYVIKSDPTLTAKELTDFCNNHPMLAKYKRPRYYRFVEELPFTATGKKMHFKVKEQAAHDLAQGLLERV